MEDYAHDIQSNAGKENYVLDFITLMQMQKNRYLLMLCAMENIGMAIYIVTCEENSFQDIFTLLMVISTK